MIIFLERVFLPYYPTIEIPTFEASIQYTSRIKRLHFPEISVAIPLHKS